MQTEARSAENGVASEIVEELRVRIEAWRSSEDRGKRMPEELWQAAGTAAQRLGVFPVSRSLGLNYQTLKRRAYPSGESLPSKNVSHPGFIEVAGFAPPNGIAPGEAIVEMIGPAGARVTVRLKDSSPMLLSVIHTLRGAS